MVNLLKNDKNILKYKILDNKHRRGTSSENLIFFSIL